MTQLALKLWVLAIGGVMALGCFGEPNTEEVSADPTARGGAGASGAGGSSEAEPGLVEGTLGPCPFAACGGELIGDFALASLCVEGLEEALDQNVPSACREVMSELRVQGRGELSLRDDGTAQVELLRRVTTELSVDPTCWRAMSGISSELTVAICALVASELPRLGFTEASCVLQAPVCHCDAALVELTSGEGTYSAGPTDLELNDGAGTVQTFQTCRQAAQLRLNTTSGEGITTRSIWQPR